MFRVCLGHHIGAEVKLRVRARGEAGRRGREEGKAAYDVANGCFPG